MLCIIRHACCSTAFGDFSLLIQSEFPSFLQEISVKTHLYDNLWPTCFLVHLFFIVVVVVVVRFCWGSRPVSVMYCRDMSLYMPKIEKPQPHNYRALWVFPNRVTIISVLIFIFFLVFSTEQSDGTSLDDTSVGWNLRYCRTYLFFLLVLKLLAV